MSMSWIKETRGSSFACDVVLGRKHEKIPDLPFNGQKVGENRRRRRRDDEKGKDKNEKGKRKVL